MRSNGWHAVRPKAMRTTERTERIGDETQANRRSCGAGAPSTPPSTSSHVVSPAVHLLRHSASGQLSVDWCAAAWSGAVPVVRVALLISTCGLVLRRRWFLSGPLFRWTRPTASLPRWRQRQHEQVDVMPRLQRTQTIRWRRGRVRSCCVGKRCSLLRRGFLPYKRCSLWSCCIGNGERQGSRRCR